MLIVPSCMTVVVVTELWIDAERGDVIMNQEPE